MSLLEIRSLSAGYRGKTVLRDVNFSMDEGDHVAMVGPNGTGKTTLLWSLVGLVPTSSGDVLWRGRPRGSEDDWTELRREMTLLFQDPDDQLFCPTVLEDVAFGPYNLGFSFDEAEKRAREVLEDLGMARHAERMSHRLSGGEKKMVALACVLAMRPRILLLDEPLAGLDESASERVIEILRGLSCGLMVVSHSRRLLAEVCSSGYYLADGVLEPWRLDSESAELSII